MSRHMLHTQASRFGVTIEPLDTRVLARAKRAFTTRRVPIGVMQKLVSGRVRPRMGDVVLARIDRIGHHGKLELTTGRRALLHVGDEVIVAYGHRYAPDQFESQVPLDLRPTQLIASGGIASQMLSRCDSTRRPTDISPIGLVADECGRPLNLIDFGLSPCMPSEDRPVTVAVLGTSMNSGKTTTVHALVRGLVAAGRDPGTTKVTGTGSGGDYWQMLDAGAHMTLDFTDVGLASTYRVDIAVVERKSVELIEHLCHGGCGAVVVEVADGVFQRETSRLMISEAFRSRIDAFIFAAADSAGAIGGLQQLLELGLPVVAVSGKLTRSPLSIREVTGAIELPVLTPEELADPAVVAGLLGLDTPAELATSMPLVVPLPIPDDAREPAYEAVAETPREYVVHEVASEAVGGFV